MFAAWLAYGEKGDQSGADWVLILVGVLIFAVVGVLAAVPIGVAGRRATPGRRELVLAGGILWGIVTVYSALTTASAQFKWAHERDLLVLSGYYDPATRNDAPAKPWGWWAGLAACYPVLLVLAWAKRPARGAGRPLDTPEAQPSTRPAAARENGGTGSGPGRV